MSQEDDQLQRRTEGKVAAAVDRIIARGEEAHIVMFAACALGAAHFAAQDPADLPIEMRAALHQFFLEEAKRWDPLGAIDARAGG